MARIVVMDDSNFQRMVLTKIVKAEGHEIFEAGDGREGLFKIATYWPDCVMVDLVMPNVGGLDVLEVLSNKQFKVPVIVITADIQETTRERCQNLGAAGFIIKPIKADQVRKTLHQVLDSIGIK
ncbi:Response regulator [Candidatus Magnetomoraceae bacterium gMMP-15]